MPVRGTSPTGQDRNGWLARMAATTNSNQFLEHPSPPILVQRLHKSIGSRFDTRQSVVLGILTDKPRPRQLVVAGCVAQRVNVAAMAPYSPYWMEVVKPLLQSIHNRPLKVLYYSVYLPKLERAKDEMH